jgi:hypothetical protein
MRKPDGAGGVIWALAMMLAGAEPAMLEPGEQLVFVGRDRENLDACASVGRVTNLGHGREAFLAVRTAPSVKARIKDKVKDGQILTLCDDSGEWLGVVYSLESDGNIDCGVATPSAYFGAYRGPCRFGWVNSRYVELIAG